MQEVVGSTTHSIVRRIHKTVVRKPRAAVLVQHILKSLPENTPLRGLDVGCGEGHLSASIMELRPRISITGIDTANRPNTAIPVVPYQGNLLPFRDNYFDFCLLIDVLHHAKNPEKLLSECLRVSSGFVIVKDHFAETDGDRAILRWMDWVGNPRGNQEAIQYFSRASWNSIVQKINAFTTGTTTELKLYPSLLKPIFERGLHFMTEIRNAQATS